MKRFFVGAISALLSLAAFGTTLAPVQLLNPSGSTAGQAIVSTGASSPPAWGSVTVGGLAAIAANTVLANATASSAAPAAFGMPSCSTSASALNWTTSTGFTCNAAVNAAQLGGATFAAPGPIGTTTAATGAFTTLSASGTVSGAGFTNLLASPPAIGGTTPAAVSSTTLTHSQQERDTGYTYSTPTTGQTVTMASGTQTALISPAGTLANLTITMPACTSGYDGSIARFVSFQNITALTLNATSGSVVAPNTSLTVGVGHAYICRGVATAWYPLY